MKEIFRICDQIYQLLILLLSNCICKYITLIYNKIFLISFHFLTFRFFYKTITGHFTGFISCYLHLLSPPPIFLCGYRFSFPVLCFPFTALSFISFFSNIHAFWSYLKKWRHQRKRIHADVYKNYTFICNRCFFRIRWQACIHRAEVYILSSIITPTGTAFLYASFLHFVLTIKGMPCVSVIL
ncbi:hypothetical protein HMPREF1040_0553 [Megasphaera sp. UPII 135-E]|nr:hypothetical protein HMPREF1040_0553 [Megasphaera sp. UPII 135-E]